jgi:hypothetical protein
MGQGSACCRYLLVDGDGIHCGKLAPVWARQVDDRVKRGVFVASGDNCEGIPMEEKL